MKQYSKIVLGLSLILSGNSMALSQGFGIENLDFSPFQTVYKSEIEMCSANTRDAVSLACIQKNMRKDWQEGTPQPYNITKAGIRIVKGSASASSNIRTVQSQRRIIIAQQQKQQRDAERRDFFERRRAERLEAARRARRIAYEKKQREIAEDKWRAANAEAATNAALQGITNQRIANDYWHANEGRAMAQNVARQAVGAPKGMMITTNSRQPQKTTGKTLANNLKRNAKVQRQRPLREGGMGYYSRRPSPPVVRQKPNPDGKYVFTGRETKTQIFIAKDPRFQTGGSMNGPKYANGGSQFRLDPHATVTTGQDWHSSDFSYKNVKKIPEPLTRIVSTEQKYREYQKMIDELLPGFEW